MGADITLSSQCLGSRSCRFAARDFKHSAVVIGPTPLQAAPLAIPDLRAGFAYVMAALLANGTSTIHNVHYIERGYADMPAELRSGRVPGHGSLDGSIMIVIMTRRLMHSPSERAAEGSGAVAPAR